MDITIIGVGNVGTHLYNEFCKEKITVSAIWSKNIENAKKLNPEISTSSLDFSNSKSEYFIIAVKDDKITEVVENIKLPANAIICHTSGSIGIDVFQNKFENCGIFYPLQTFSKDRALDFSEIPFLLEASNKETLIELTILADLISKNVQKCNSKQRRQIHLAAVFASNFVNKLLGISKEILEEKNLDFSLLQPLVKEQIKKSFDISPEKAQTGPAIRGDKKTIAKHLDMLGDQKDYQKLYKLISEIIKK